MATPSTACTVGQHFPGGTMKNSYSYFARQITHPQPSISQSYQLYL